METVVVGTCKCGGYGIVFNERAQRETGACHHTVEEHEAYWRGRKAASLQVTRLKAIRDFYRRVHLRLYEEAQTLREQRDRAEKEHTEAVEALEEVGGDPDLSVADNIRKLKMEKGVLDFCTCIHCRAGADDGR